MVSINLEIIMYIESKGNETVTVPFFTYEQLININKDFSVIFPVETSLKIQLTTDMEPGFRNRNAGIFARLPERN